jgi:hypothetical protein
LVPFESVSLISHPCLLAVLRLMRERVAPVSARTCILESSFPEWLYVQERRWRQVACVHDYLCDCVAGVVDVPPVEVRGDLIAFFSLLLLLLLVPLLLLLPLVLFECLELLEICARICRLSCICCRSNLSICVQTLSVVADDCVVSLLLSVRAGVRLCWAVLPVLVGGLLAAAVAWLLCPVWFALAFAFVDDCVACCCCTG